MSFEKLAERLIREAMKEGVFDNLPNAGKRLDLDDYFKAPEEWRAAYGLLKSANIVPEAVDVLREIDRLERALETEQNQDLRRDLLQQIDRYRLRFELLKEQNRRNTAVVE